MPSHSDIYLKSQFKSIFKVFIAIIFLQSCLAHTSKTITYQPSNSFYDQVKGRYVQELDFFFYGIIFSNNSFHSADQRTIKYTEKTGEMYIEVFDNLKIEFNNFQIEPIVYIVLSDSSFQIPLKTLSTENQTSIDEETEDILTADSSRMTVVTDYTVNQYKFISCSYSLDSLQTKAILNSSELSYRYYYGPEIINLKLSPSRLMSLKKLISSNPTL